MIRFQSLYILSLSEAFNFCEQRTSTPNFLLVCMYKTFTLLVYKGSKFIHVNGIVNVYEYIYVSVCKRYFACCINLSLVNEVHVIKIKRHVIQV